MSKFKHLRMQIRMRIPACERMRIHMRVTVQEDQWIRMRIPVPRYKQTQMRISVTFLNNTSYYQMGAAFDTEY